ncbi:piRNA biogenesis protein EXD1-like [Asterias rubens]|uniref:piRNA biogenesis protein EXD1-like n=1 Tax=Asterias rubens TaxID=7604 RepID=UPI001455BB0D|nr:piRNA biogenesis protein EXD1-like [Asterias rubens]
MAMYEGRRLRVVTKEGGYVFEGTVHSIDLNNSKISLMKVCLVPSGKKLTGLLHFYGPELQELVDISDTVQAEEKKNKQQLHENGGSSSDDEDNNAKTTEYIYLRRIGTTFEQAINQIRSQRLIGVALEAETLGRKSKLSLLQICCGNQVYIFDIVTLGPVFFSQGLADILESQAIVKVIHDSRWTSDQLFHQYSIKLTNVYDTQAADVLIRMRRLNGELPHKLSGLTQCLLEYLDMSVEALYPQLLHDQAKTVSQTMWMERPLSPKLLLQAAFNVRHLSDLRLKTLDHLLAEFTASVDVFLNCIRDMSDMNRGKANVSSSVVPRQLERLVYGDLPSTSTPVTNQRAVSTGLDPIKTEAPPLVAKTEKLQPSTSHASNESTTTHSNYPPPSTSSKPNPSTNNTEQFCVPKIPVPKDTTTSDISQPRFSNGHTQNSEEKEFQWKKLGERRATTKEFTTTKDFTTVVFSPSSDGRSIVKLAQGVADPKETVSSTENENTEGSFDASLGFKKSERDGQRLPEDVMALSVRGEGRNDGAGCGRDDVECKQREGSSDTLCEEEAKDESSESEDEKYTDFEDEDDLPDQTSVNYSPVLTYQTELAKSLSLSPHQRMRKFTQEMSTTSAKNLPSNYLGQRGIPTLETKSVEKPGGRLYSRVLTDVGLIGKLNIASETQFPGLDPEIHGKPQKHSPSRDEGRSSRGAIPKRPTLQSLYPSTPISVSETVEDEVTSRQGLDTPMARPSVGRGRAMTLACYEDMRRNLHRPLELHIGSTANGDGRYDFPSQEELARVPKQPPQRASSYVMVPDGL